MKPQPAARLLLWHQILLLVAVLTLSLAAFLMFATYRTMNGLEAEIGTNGNDVLFRQTEEFLGALAQEQTRTLDERLARAEVAAALAGVSFSNDCSREHVNPATRASDVVRELSRLVGRGNMAFIVSNAGELFRAARDEDDGGEAVIQQLHDDLARGRATLRIGHAVWGQVHRSLLSEQRDFVVNAVSPVLLEGVVWGFVGVSVSLTDLLADVNQRPPVRSAYSFLLDSERRLVGVTPQGRLDLAPPGADGVDRLIDLSRTGSASLDAAVSDMALGGADVRLVDAKGDAKYLAYHPLNTIDWRVGLIVSVPMVTTIPAQKLMAVVDQAAREAISQTLLVTVLFLLVALVLGAWTAHRLAEPLRQMTLITERIVGGDLGARVEVSTGDEIGRLGRFFNAMTEHIEGLVHDLERRAAELARTNDALTRQTELLESVLHAMRDAVVGAENDGRVLVWNPATERLLGAPPDAESAQPAPSVGWFLSDQTSPVAPRDLPFPRAMRGDDVDDVEVFLRNSTDPAGTWLSITARPLRHQDGTLRGGVVVLRDITLAKRALEIQRRVNDELDARVKERTAELAEAQRQLIETARSAGMAEIATNVLHNVGNVLSGVKVGTSTMVDKVRASRAQGVRRVADLLKAHEADIATFLSQDEKGRMLPAYVNLLADALDAERTDILGELDALKKRVDHIANIVRVQQGYASGASLVERISLTELVEDALRMTAASKAWHGIEIVREIERDREVVLDKHKVLQILVNLVTNASHALAQSSAPSKRLLIRARATPEQGVAIEVIDNGVGIAEEAFDLIFRYGFTTRKDGHGFGLHSSALFAKAMGGSLTAHSAGRDQGATFTLKLPNRIK